MKLLKRRDLLKSSIFSNLSNTEELNNLSEKLEIYKKFIGIKEKYRVTYTAQVDQTIEATSLEEAKKIAKNGTGEYENQAFESIYLSEVAFITDKDGNEL